MKSITTQAAEEVYLHSKRVFSLFILTLLLFSSFLILNQNAEAQLFCPMSAIDQITDETAGNSLEPSINADGTRIGFTSEADINMGNPDGNAEVYLIVCFDPPAHPDPVRMGSNRYGGSIGDSRIYGYEKKESNFLID